MGKASSQALKPEEIEAMARQQNRMNNPNQENAFGSTNTTFDANDQASIVQSLSPMMQQQLDQQMGMLQQGPAQLGAFSNPWMESMMQGNSDAIARRGGYAGGDASQQGGFNTSNQAYDPQQSQLADALGVDPMAPMDMGPSPTGGLSGLGSPIGFDEEKANQQAAYMQSQAPSQEMSKPMEMLGNIGNGLRAAGGGGGGMGGGGNGGQFAQLGEQLAMLANKKKAPDDYNVRS